MGNRLVKETGNTSQIFRHFYKGGNFCDFLFAFPVHRFPSKKGSAQKGKRRKIFPFVQTPFHKEPKKNILTNLSLLKVYKCPLTTCNMFGEKQKNKKQKKKKKTHLKIC